MYKQILVPVDGSDTGRLGLDEAIKLAKSLKASVRLIHVVEKPVLISPEPIGPGLQQLFDQLRSGGECILHDSITAVRSADVPVDSRLIEKLGTGVGECIIEQAASWPADLIVCGTHGRRGVRRLLMGSDAEYILRHSSVPVLMVRGPHGA
jgi:nucleotide-binding universal stress UspA family protein